MSILRSMRVSWHCWRMNRGEKTLLWVFRRLPSRLKDRLMLYRMGELSSKPCLGDCEVPSITTDQFIQAMKEPRVA